MHEDIDPPGTWTLVLVRVECSAKVACSPREGKAERAQWCSYYYFLPSHGQLIGQRVSGREAALPAEDARSAIRLGAVAAAGGMDKPTSPS